MAQHARDTLAFAFILGTIHYCLCALSVLL